MAEDDNKIPGPPPLPPAMSLKPDPLTGLVHVTMAPGTTIKSAGPPPSVLAQAVALFPDVVAMGLIAIAGSYNAWSPQVVIGGITGILLLRVKPSQPGDQATSGVFGAVGAIVRTLRTGWKKVSGRK